MKKIFIAILGLIISISAIGNIKTQFNTLKEAKRKNMKIENEIAKLSQDNQIISQKIEYATSSAFLEQEARDKLALGNKNDIWLKLGNEENIDLFPKVNESEEIPKIRQWISLFTR